MAPASLTRDGEILNVVNEEKKQVIICNSYTPNASTNDCVRYIDIGNERQEDDSNVEFPAKKKSPKASLPSTSSSRLAN